VNRDLVGSDRGEGERARQGVMGEEYATGRMLERPLIFRLQFRAVVATREYLLRRGPDPAPRVLELGAADGLTHLEIRRLLPERGEYHGGRVFFGTYREVPDRHSQP